MALPQSATEHSLAQRRLLAAVAIAVRQVWDAMGADFDASWAVLGPRLLVLLAAAQRTATIEALAYVTAVVDELALDAPAVATVAPASLVGVAPDGRGLASLLYETVIRAKIGTATGLSPTEALASGGRLLDLIATTTVSDTSRTATSLGMASRPAITGYVRVLNRPSCSRCVILAGKWYRWNDGFARHPGCDCYHLPAAKAKAHSETTDPYAYFRGLSAAQQDATFGKAGAQSIRDGADIFQVVNANRRSAGLTTLEGVSSRSGFAAGRLNGDQPLPRYARPSTRRLTPEGVYRIASDRAEALRLLEQHGYITGYGQTSEGAIQGAVGPGREGFGQMGRGGTRVGARQAVLAARRTGVRDPNNPATMTAAERRAWRARTTT